MYALLHCVCDCIIHTHTHTCSPTATAPLVAFTATVVLQCTCATSCGGGFRLVGAAGTPDSVEIAHDDDEAAVQAALLTLPDLTGLAAAAVSVVMNPAGKL
jgi:hypothetical protein